MSSLLIYLVLLFGCSGNELLDYVHTETYWKQQNIPISAEHMIQSLHPAEVENIEELIRQLGSKSFRERRSASKQLAGMGPEVIEQLSAHLHSEDPEILIRVKELVDHLSKKTPYDDIQQLMAIRTLGELESEIAIAPLEQLTRSKQPFVATYAQQALAAIRGEANPAANPLDRTPLHSDLRLMPADTALVVQADVAYLSGNGNVFQTLDALRGDLLRILGGDMIQIKSRITNTALKIGRHSGNFRLDAISFGLSGNLKGREHYFTTLVIRGQHEPHRLLEVGAEIGGEVIEVNGSKLLTLDNEALVFSASPERLIITATRGNLDQIPDQLIAGFKNPPAHPLLSEILSQQLAQLDRGAAAWGALVMTEDFRSKDEFDSITAVRAVLEMNGAANEHGQLTLDAEGHETQGMQDLAEQLREEIAKELPELEKAILTLPTLRPFTHMIKSVVIQDEEAAINISIDLPAGVGGPQMLLPWLIDSHF